MFLVASAVRSVRTADVWTAAGHLAPAATGVRPHLWFVKLTIYRVHDAGLAAQDLKDVMPAFVSKLSALWTLVAAHLRSLLLLPDRGPGDFPFLVSEVAQLHRLRTDPATASIDDATWKDLLLEPYCAALSQEVSIFGQQVLYQRLRAGMGEAPPERVKAFLDKPEHVQELHRQCEPLRRADKEIASLLYEDALPPVAGWAPFTWLLPLALVIALAGAVISPLAWPVIVVVLVLVLGVLFGVQLQYAQRVEEWQRSIAALQILLRVTASLGGKDAAVAGRCSLSFSRAVLTAAVPSLRSYHDWFGLGNVNHYFKSIKRVRDRLPLLRACFEHVANLEADVALARHLLGAGTFCWAEPSAMTSIALEETVHPLLAHAQPLTLALQGRGAFISGQNGIGKSTLLRTLGINLVAARAFGFCYAKRASVPLAPVYASMQSEDSLLGGESLYMAELRRAKELLSAAEGPHPGVYIIDGSTCWPPRAWWWSRRITWCWRRCWRTGSTRCAWRREMTAC